MNDWAKVTGMFTAFAGIVYIIAVLFALVDGLDFGTDDLATFATNSKYGVFVEISAVLLAIAGVSIVGYGVNSNRSLVSVLGVFVMIAAAVLIVSAFKDDLTNITWSAMENLLVGAFIFIAAGGVLAGLTYRQYEVSIICVIFGFILDSLYQLYICEGMLVPLVGAILLIFIAGELFIIGKMPEIVEAPASEEVVPAAVSTELPPAKAAVPANPPVVKEPVPAKAAEPVAKPAAAKAKVETQAKEAVAPAKAAEPVAEPAVAEKKAEPPVKTEEVKPAETPAVVAPAAAPAAEEESEQDKLLKQGWEVAVAKVGEDKANEMSDEEIVAVVKSEDEQLYNKISAVTGIVIAEPVKTEEAKTIDDEDPAAKCWAIAVAKVGEDKANEMSDEEILALVKAEDEDLYNQVRASIQETSVEDESASAPVEVAAVPEEKAEPQVKTEEVKPAETPAVVAPAAAPAAEEESEQDKLLKQGWEVAVAKVGEDKANEMSDEEIVAVVKSEDEQLYNKISAATGITVAGIAAAAVTVAAAESAEKPKETEFDRLLKQGWEEVVTNVGEERANELDDYGIMAVLSVVDPELYNKLSILTGITVSNGDVEESVEMESEVEFYDDTTPEGFLRRACWNKGLRCRKDYGPYYIPVAFVKSKVAVYVDGPVPDNRNDKVLTENGWIVLHFPESEITDGATEAKIVNSKVKENLRAMKKAKAKKKKR